MLPELFGLYLESPRQPLNTAYAVVEDNPSPNPRVQAETLEELRMLAEEARMEVKQTKREYGFKD